MSRGHSGPSGPFRTEAFFPSLGSPAGFEIRRAAPPARPVLWKPAAILLDQWVAQIDPLSGGASLEAELQKSQKNSLGGLLSQMPYRYSRVLQQKLGERSYQELVSLLREPDKRVLLHQLQVFGMSLAHDKRFEASASIFQQVIALAGSDAALAQTAARAREELDTLLGRGPLGRVLAFQGERIFEQALDPWMVLGFGAASAAFKATRFFALAKMTANPAWRFNLGETGIKLLASGLALGTEAPAFVATVHGARRLFGVGELPSAESFLHETQATALTLFFLKGFGAASQKAFNRFHGIDALRPELLRLPALTRISQVAFPQAGMYLGILFAHGAEARLGLRTPVEGSNPFAEALGALCQFNFGGWIADRALGRGFKSWQMQMDGATHDLTRGPGMFEALRLPQFFPRFAGAQGEDLGPPIYLAENHNGNGNGGKTGKVIELFPGKAPKETDHANGQSLPPKYSPEEIAELALGHERNAERLVGDFTRFLSALEFHAQIYLGHLHRNRGGMEQVREISRDAREAESELWRLYLDAKKAHENLGPLTFVSAQDPQAHARVLRSRSQLDHFLGMIRLLHEQLTPVTTALHDTEVLPLFRQMLRFVNGSRFSAEAMLETDTQLLDRLNKIMTEEKIGGMVRGVLIRDLFRVSNSELEAALSQLGSRDEVGPLSFDSPRRKDLQILQAIVRSMRPNSGSEKNYFNNFILHPSDSESGAKPLAAAGPREMLRWGGDIDHPFRTWVGLYVPTLLAFNGGEFSRFVEKTAPLELLMPEQTFAASRATAWWLDRALHADGPVEVWERQLAAEKRVPTSARVLSRKALSLARQSDWNAETAARELGETGDLAALAHGLAAFARYPFNHQAAMDLSLKSPEGVREEASAVTGALLGAFHGRSKFSPEWTSDVVTRFVFGHNNQKARFKWLLTQEQYFSHLLSELVGATRELDKPNRLATVPPPGHPLEAVRDSFEVGFGDRFSAFETARVETGFALTSTLNRRASEAGPSRNLADPREDFHRAVSKMDAAYRALKGFVSQSEKRVKALGPEEVRSEYFLPYREKLEVMQKAMQKVRAIETKLAGLGPVSGGTAPGEPEPSLRLWLQNQLMSLLRPFPSRAGSVETLPPGRRPFRAGEIDRLQEAAAMLGKSQAPQAATVFFGQRSDKAVVDLMVKRHKGTLPAQVPTVEHVLQIYLLVMGIPVKRWNNRSLAEQVSMSAMLSVVLPAYLELNRDRLGAVYQELQGLPVEQSIQTRESWRAVTFLALRLFEGDPPADRLVREAEQFFGDSPMGRRFKRLAEIRANPDPIRAKFLMSAWENSKDPRDRVMLGVQAFLAAPRDFARAMEGAPPGKGDKEQTSDRVLALLLAASGLQPQKIRTEPPGMLYYLDTKRENAVTDRSQPEDLPFNPDAWGRKVHDFLAVWLRASKVASHEQQAERLMRAWDSQPGYFIRELANFAFDRPLLAKAMLVRFGLVPADSPLAADVEVRRELGRKVGDTVPQEELEVLLDRVVYLFRHNALLYFPETYQADRISEPSLKEKLRELPPTFLFALNNVELSPPQFLFMMHHLKLSDFGYPKFESLPE